MKSKNENRGVVIDTSAAEFLAESDSRPMASKLKKGDKCTWLKRDGTIVFTRGCQALRTEDGDDKFILYPQNLAQFDVVMEIVGQITGLKPVLEGDYENRVVYRFE
jgi:hypothetical protein